MKRVLVFVAASITWGCAAPGASAKSMAPTADVAATEPLTAEDLVSIRSVSSVALSPDTKHIAYVLRTPTIETAKPAKPRSVIWMVDRDGGEPMRLTAPDSNAYSPTWSPDGQWLTFLSTRGDDDGLQVYKISPLGGEAERLTNVEGGLNHFEWSPHGQSLAYVKMRDPASNEKAAQDRGQDWETTDVDGSFQRLWLLDLASGQTSALGPRDLHVAGFRWSPDGQRILVHASERADFDGVLMYSGLYIYDREGHATQLTTTQGKLGRFDWSPDGQTIAFLGATDIHDPTAGVLHVVPASGGQAHALTPTFEGTGLWLRWTQSNTITLLAAQGTQTTLHTVDPQSGTMRALLDDGPVCGAIDLDPTGKTIACAGSTQTHPPEVYAGTLGRKAGLSRRTHSNPELSRKTLGSQEVVRWKAKDGLEIDGVLIKPVGYQAGTPYPLAVLPHGGPEGISLDGWTSYATYPAQLFANHGFVVLMPNYRGSAGRGVAFGKADQKDLGGQEFEDVIAGIDHLAAQGLIDPERVGMGGWSYGGYFSGLAATQHSKRFKAAMVGAGITNWISFTGTTEIEHENSLVHWNLWPYEHYDLAWERSPMAHVAESTTATLVVHGTADTRVPIGQATELYRALRHFGVPTQIVRYPREGHGLSEREHQADFAQRFVDWFVEYVK